MLIMRRAVAVAGDAKATFVRLCSFQYCSKALEVKSLAPYAPSSYADAIRRIQVIQLRQSVAVVEELQQKATKTARCRFIAAQRLWLHHRFSQWTVALASVSLLLIPLLQAFGVGLEYTPQQLNVFQILLAVIVLVFSVLLGLEDYGIRSDRMHRCGTEINELAHKMRPYLQGEVGDYNRFVGQYHAILQKYENHSQLDYRIQQLQNSGEYFDSRWSQFKTLLAVVFRSVLDFIHYIFLFALILPLIYSIFAFGFS